MELHREQIVRRLQELARKDKKRKVFGSAAHDYQLNPPLDLRTVEAFEAEHGVELPDDYKLFITGIGNGGAGPFYGLFPFGHDDEGAWNFGVLVGDVGKPFPHNEAWNLTEGFWENEPDPPEGISEAEEDRLWEEWDKELEAHYWNTDFVNGAIPICHLGCALRQWLVIHGDQSGFVWTDYRADDAGLFPLKGPTERGMTFTDWYLAWLDNPNMKMPTG